MCVGVCVGGVVWCGVVCVCVCVLACVCAHQSEGFKGRGGGGGGATGMKEKNKCSNVQPDAFAMLRKLAQQS